MAKRGLGNERENAEKLLRKLCLAQNLEYDAVLNDLLIEEFEFCYGKEGISQRLVVQVIARYAMLEGSTSYAHNEHYKRIYVKTTKEKWNDFLSAVSVIKVQYEKQRKLMLTKQKRERNMFFHAFIHKNTLFYPYPLDAQGKAEKLTPEELRILAEIYESMEGVQISRQLQDKN